MNAQGEPLGAVRHIPQFQLSRRSRVLEKAGGADQGFVIGGKDQRMDREPVSSQGRRQRLLGRSLEDSDANAGGEQTKDEKPNQSRAVRSQTAQPHGRSPFGSGSAIE